MFHLKGNTIVSECNLISSLPGKALQLIFESSTCVLKAEPGELDIKRRKLWNSIYQFTCWFTHQNCDYDVVMDVRVDSMASTTPFKTYNVT